MSWRVTEAAVVERDGRHPVVEERDPVRGPARGGEVRRLSTALAFLALALPAASRLEGSERAVPRPGESPRAVARDGAGPERLLRPEHFGRLSAGGRRLVRAWNGIPGPARIAAPTRTVAPRAALAAPSPGLNVRVNDPSMDADGRTNSESAVVASGGNVVVAFNDASVDTSGYAFSRDGGATFTHRRLPPPPDGSLYGDPALAVGPAGEVYYATLMAVGGGYLSTVGVAKSTDGGETFSDPVDAVNAWTESFEVMDDPAIAVDAASASKSRGWVYVAWTYFGPFGETGILFARSVDGGETFSAPGFLTPLDRAGVRGASLVVGPAGEIYAAWLDGHTASPSILVRKSTDGGSRFSDAKRVASVTPLELLTGGGGVLASSHPRLAVDGSGRLHVAWAARPAGRPADRADVFHARSTDGGASFSAPRRVNDDATATSQSSPAIAATAGGRVAIRWIDRRNDPENDALADVFVAVSPDGGATFARSFRVTDTSWAYGPVEPGLPPGYHGEDGGLATSGEDLLVTWSDERGSDPDVYFARVLAELDPLAPDLGLTPAWPWAAVRAGGSATLDVATTRTGVAGAPFALALSGAGSGITASISPASVLAGERARLALAAAPDVPARTDLLTVTADGAGIARGTVLRVTSYPAGRAFEPPANLTRTRGQTGGAALLDPSGRLHAVFEDDTDDVSGAEVFYARGTTEGTDLAARQRLSAGAGAGAVLAAGAAGRVVVAWAGRGPADTTDRVWVARSSDGGATFAAAVAASPASQRAAFPAVALDGAGGVLVAWYDFDPDVAVLYTARSTDGGATFGPPAAVDDDSVGYVTRPGLAFDAKGAAYLVYTRQYHIPGTVASAARLAVARDGRTFGAPVSLTDEARAESFAPDVAVGADDTLLVTYYTRVVTPEGTYNRDVVVVRSTDGGATFSPPVNVSGNDGQSWFPAIVAAPGGGVLVAWEDDTGRGASDLLVARSTDGGATFSAPVDVSATPGISGSAANPLAGPGGPGRASVSVAADGRALVSWLDDSLANPDVFAVRLDPRALTNRAPAVAIVSPAPGAVVEAGVAVPFAGSGSDPDGDALAFAWRFGDGRAAAGADAASHTYPSPGTYVATLTATDPLGASAAASVRVTVTPPSVSGESLLLPVVLEAPGVGGSRFTSEVTLASRRAAPTEVLLSYTAALGSGSGFARLTLAPGEQRVVPGIVAWLRGRGLPIPGDGSSQAGTLLATFAGASGDVFAGARTFTADPAGGAGTFGVFYTSVAPSAGPVAVFGLRQDEGQRSNLALVNGGGSPITLRVSLFGPAGEPLEALPDVTLGPLGWTQLGQPLAGRAASGRAVVTRVAGDAPFAAYGVRNDAVTSDGSYVAPLGGDDGSGGSRLVPVVLDVAGLGARFRTELTLANLSSSPLALTLAYVAAPGFGSGSGTVGLTLAAGEQRALSDAISFLRAVLPIEADGRSVAGSLRIDAPEGTPASAFAAGARTFAPLSPAGSYGLFYAGLTVGEASDGVAWVHALREDAAERSNVALVHRGDAPGDVTLRVTFFDGAGRTLGEPADVTLGPGEWRQLGRPLRALGASQGYARVERVAGRARFVAYGVRNDNASADGSYVPMSR